MNSTIAPPNYEILLVVTEIISKNYQKLIKALNWLQKYKVYAEKVF
jgi:hypothetical protein